jgi:uncharacterized repeat protein (TIGR03803 family)
MHYSKTNSKGESAMKKLHGFNCSVILSLGMLMVSTVSQVQAQANFAVLHTFTGGEAGANPWVGVSIDGAGSLYGTTHNGSGYGTVYKLKHEGSGWILDILLDFQNGDMGAYPYSRPYIAHDGTLYGSTLSGPDYNCGGSGCGIIYHLTPSPAVQKSVTAPWTETILYNFANLGAAGPLGDLLVDQVGNIYGTVEDGGSCQFCGIVYELTPTQDGWQGKALHEFQMNGDGTQPFGGVVTDTAGNLYGVTEFGGVYNQGTVYELSPSGSGWTETILHSFNANGIDGYKPVGGLTIDASGNLYGTTPSGGSNGQGTAFELSSVQGSWLYSVLYSFVAAPGSDGPYWGPEDKLALDSGGNLYGTTFTDGAYDCGSVFELSPSEDGIWNYTSLHDFTCGSDGAAPVSTVTFDTEGNMYGTAAGGGNYSDCDGGCGVIWEITPHQGGAGHSAESFSIDRRSHS